MVLDVVGKAEFPPCCQPDGLVGEWPDLLAKRADGDGFVETIDQRQLVTNALDRIHEIPISHDR